MKIDFESDKLKVLIIDISTFIGVNELKYEEQ